MKAKRKLRDREAYVIMGCFILPWCLVAFRSIKMLSGIALFGGQFAILVLALSAALLAEERLKRLAAQWIWFDIIEMMALTGLDQHSLQLLLDQMLAAGLLYCDVCPGAYVLPKTTLELLDERCGMMWPVRDIVGSMYLRRLEDDDDSPGK